MNSRPSTRIAKVALPPPHVPSGGYLGEREGTPVTEIRPCLDWSPMIVKALHNIFAFLSLYTDVLEACLRQQSPQ